MSGLKNGKLPARSARDIEKALQLIEGLCLLHVPSTAEVMKMEPESRIVCERMLDARQHLRALDNGQKLLAVKKGAAAA